MAKHQPMRRCVVCRESRPKRELVRIVRSPDGEIALDLTGKAAGRGAYLCNTSRCWARALEHGHLGRALNTTLDEAARLQLHAYADALPNEL